MKSTVSFRTKLFFRKITKKSNFQHFLKNGNSIILSVRFDLYCFVPDSFEAFFHAGSACAIHFLVTSKIKELFSIFWFSNSRCYARLRRYNYKKIQKFHFFIQMNISTLELIGWYSNSCRPYGHQRVKGEGGSVVEKTTMAYFVENFPLNQLVFTSYQNSKYFSRYRD